MIGRSRFVKLVRDRCAEKLPDTRVHYDKIDRAAHIRELRKKLGEEALEYIVDPSPQELADVLEVVYALCHYDLCITHAELNALRCDKQAEMGGFTEGLGMFATTTASVEHGG